MIFHELPISGAYIIEPERYVDERGFFARLWCYDEFSSLGLETRLVQCSMSYNSHAGTLRGMHYQVAPYEEVKIVRCARGGIFDVIIDLRPDSATFAQHCAVELTALNRKMLYIPKRFAHGFQTLDNETEVVYQMSEFYHPESARGLRWNDPAFGIAWPSVERRIINERDATYPDFQPTVGDSA